MRLFNKTCVGGLVMLTMIGSLSCSKDKGKEVATENTDFSNQAVVQFFVATHSATRNYVYIDTKQVTGAVLTAGSLFPSSGVGVSVDGGLRSFLVKDTLVTSTQPALNFGENMNANSHYTVFLYDTITAPKQKTVKDNIVIPKDTTARLRFANFVYNNVAVANVDVYSWKLGANIFTNVAVTDVTDFITYASRLSVDSLFIRETGTTNNLIKVPINGLTPKRNYTVVYRGSHKVTKAATLYATY